MGTSGYQSDLVLRDLRGQEGNLPLENSLGGYGVTSETGANTYTLTLDPKLTKPYTAGLPVQVSFHKENTAGATLNIDNKGGIPLKKFNGNALVPLEAGDLKTTLIYQLIYDGNCFQVVTGIVPETNMGISQNRQEEFSILDENINLDDVFYINNANKYAVINGNLVISQNIRLRRVGGAGGLGGSASGGPVLKMPIAANTSGVMAWTTQSSEGGFFFCQFGGDSGLVIIEGEFKSALDEVHIRIPPYIAKTPLEIQSTPVFNAPPGP